MAGVLYEGIKMNRKAWVLIGVVLLMNTAAIDAQLPKVNDTVKIGLNQGDMVMIYAGNVTNISDGVMCMKSFFSLLERPDGIDDSFDIYENGTNVCVGVGSIQHLEIIDFKEIEEALKQVTAKRS